MDTRTGRVFEVPDGEAAPHGSVPLSQKESEDLKGLVKTVKGFRSMTGIERVRRYKQMHADDPCRSCQKLLRKHTLREFQSCYSE